MNSDTIRTGDISDKQSKKKDTRSLKKSVILCISGIAVFFIVVYGGILYYEQRNHKMQFDITNVSVEPYNNTYKDFIVDASKGTFLLVHIKGNVQSWFYSPYTYYIKNIEAMGSGSYSWDFCSGIKAPFVVKKFHASEFELSCVINIADYSFRFSKQYTKDEFISWLGGMPFVASDVTKVGLFNEKKKVDNYKIRFWIQDSTEAFNHIEFKNINKNTFRSAD